MSYVGIILTFVLVNNFVLVRFLGLCPLMGVSQRLGPSVGLGLIMAVIMSLSALITWAIRTLVLVPLSIEFLQTVVFVLAVVTVIQLLQFFLQKVSVPVHRFIGGQLPLISTNCAVLGIALVSAHSGFGPLESVVAGFAAGMGFLLVIVLMATLRERLEREWIPEYMRGTPITFISAGLMAMAFMAFDKALLSNLLG